jgi:hypothetical protein
MSPDFAGRAGETGAKERHRGSICEVCHVHLDTSAFICVHLWFQISDASRQAFGCGYAAL